METEPLEPGLYIVAGPIGNLGDLTPRAADILRRADVVAVEDTRVSARLLRHAGSDRPMVPYHDHSADHVRQRLVERMGQEAVALLSDAGTPLISDPGYKLVRDARAAGRPVTTLPGPSAVIAALTLSGLPTDRFLFMGFLPAKAKARGDALDEVAALRATLAFYESGPRLSDSLAAMAAHLGDREAAVSREISKAFEETATGTLTALSARYADAPPKGEIVVIVGPPGEAPQPARRTPTPRCAKRSPAFRYRKRQAKSPRSSVSTAARSTTGRWNSRHEGNRPPKNAGGRRSGSRHGGCGSRAGTSSVAVCARLPAKSISSPAATRCSPLSR